VKVEFLQRIALFADLSLAEQKRIANRLRLQHYEEGSLIFNKGNESIALYLLKSGWVQLVADGGRATLATLGPGNILGEADCFLGRPHTVAARVTADADLWVLDNDDLQDLITEDPELGLKLSIAFGANLIQFERYLVEERLRKVSFFSHLSEEELLAIAGYLRARRFAPGDIVFSAGDEPVGLYLIESGLIRLIAVETNGNFSELREGDAFGEMAVLSGKQYTATARAAEESVLWQLTSTDFEDLTAHYPSIRQTLSRVLRERLSSDDQIVARERLERVPLFSELPSEALTALAEVLLLCHVPAEQVVFAQGDPGDALYLVESGHVEVITSSRSTGESAQAVLEEGDFLGEMALLTGKTRTTTARALTHANLWALYRTDFDSLIIRHPTISLALTQALRTRLSQAEQRFVQRHLRKISLLAELSTAELKEIADRLRPEKYRRGDIILVEGDPGDVVCFIEEGQVELLSRLGNAYIVLDRLSEGDFFGDMAILGGHSQTATVRAVTDISIWTLDQRNLEELIAKYPTLIIALSRIMGERLNQTLLQLKEASRALPAPGPVAPQHAGYYTQPPGYPLSSTPPPAPSHVATGNAAQPAAVAPQQGVAAEQTVKPQPAAAKEETTTPQPATPPPAQPAAVAPQQGVAAEQTVKPQPAAVKEETATPQPATPPPTQPAAVAPQQGDAYQTVRLKPDTLPPSQPAAAAPPPQPAAAKPETQPADPTLILPSQPPTSKAAASPQAASASAPATRAVVPATRQKPAKPGALQKSVKSAGNILGDTAAWFAALSIGAKLRLLVILLLVIWICGISVPFALITLLGSGLNSVVPIGAIQLPDAIPLAVVAPVDWETGRLVYQFINEGLL
jgi:CRP-like cAMP-binding protein